MCTQSGNQVTPTSVSDGSGGVIAVWADWRTGHPEVYAQHVLASGVLDPTWPAGGLAVCTVNITYNGIMFVLPQIVSDGAGGAIVTWSDYRGGEPNTDIYAHHILANGTVDPAWPLNGRLVCGATGRQAFPSIASDGSGGAVIAWTDFRSGVATYAQHVQSNGVVDPVWTTNGVPISLTAPGRPRMLSHGSGGALVLWAEADSTLRLQHIRPDGTLDPSWPDSGTVIAQNVGDSFQSRLVESGTGSIITWRNDDGQVLAHRVTATGALDPSWPASGRLVSTAPGIKRYPAIATDGQNGALIAWEDLQDSITLNIFCNRVLSNGTIDPAWPPNGRDLAPNTAVSLYGGESRPVIGSDGSGGAIVVWNNDDRNDLGVSHIYAQRIFGNSDLDPAWPTDGRLVCSAPNVRDFLSLAQNDGNVIAVWQDARAGQSDTDLYCQRVLLNGQLGGGATIVIPPVTITELTHTYQAPSPPFEPNTLLGDAVTFPGTGYTSSGFTATLVLGDTLVMRFQAPTGMKFVLHHPPNVVTKGLYMNAYWSAGNDVISSVDPHTLIFENASGTAPVETYSLVAAGDAGRVVTFQKEYSSSGTFEFTAVEARMRINKSFAVASRTFGPVQSFSAPSWGAYAYTSVNADATVLSLEPLPSISVPETPQKPFPFLRLASSNPARGAIVLEFSVPVTSPVGIDVFDISGRHVARITQDDFSPGVYQAMWNGRGRDGSVPPGVYFVRYSVGELSGAKRVVLLR